MNQPLFPTDFAAARPLLRAHVVEGLPGEIDEAADAAPASHRFLRRGWYAAAVRAHGGWPRTVLVCEGERPVLALPLVRAGPRPLGLFQVPGSYWPHRSFPFAERAPRRSATLALSVLAGGGLRALRIGPVADDDPAPARLIAAARRAGWAVLDRKVATSWVLELGELARAGVWPRASSLRKNRFHAKHLAEHGTVGWRTLEGADWPAGFALLAEAEGASWVATRTDRRDAKFLAESPHLAFWRAAAADPAIAAMLRATVLTVGGRAAAFSFDLDTGATVHAIANSYDPAIARHSPGKLVHYRHLADALARGAERIDWGAGDSGYKQVLGAGRGPALRDWLLLRPGLPAFAGRALAGVWRRSGRSEG